MQGWTTRIAPDAEISDRHISDKIEAEFARYKPVPGTGKWSNQREIEEARAGDGPYQIFDRRATEAALDYFDRYFDSWRFPLDSTVVAWLRSCGARRPTGTTKRFHKWGEPMS